MCAGIGLQLGGTPAVLAVAFVAAVAIDRLQHFLTKRRVPVFYQQVAGGAVATVLAAVATRAAESVVTMDASLVVSANIIMLLAGIGFMGAIQDAMTGFYVTGGARLLEAVLATAGIIAGVSGGISFATAVGLDLPTLEPARTDLAGVSVAALGAGDRGGGVRVLVVRAAADARAGRPAGGRSHSRSPRRSSQQDFARAWAVGVAAFAVGLVSYTVAGRLRVPPLVVVVPAVVPLLPGLVIYRGLSLLGAQADPAPARGLLAMVTAASIATALAAGVILGEYVAQPVKREARRVETRLAGPRLVGVTRYRRRRRGSAPEE